jgi:hypothetical protein
VGVVNRKKFDRVLERERENRMKTLLKNISFSNPTKGWNVQVNLFRFDGEERILWIYSTADIMRKTWDRVNPADLESFYSWVHNSVDEFVAHVERRPT